MSNISPVEIDFTDEQQSYIALMQYFKNMHEQFIASIGIPKDREGEPQTKYSIENDLLIWQKLRIN